MLFERVSKRHFEFGNNIIGSAKLSSLQTERVNILGEDPVGLQVDLYGKYFQNRLTKEQ